MNRKDRRAARSNRVGSASAQGIGPGAMSANLFASAVERFNAGRLDDAERLCRDVLMFNKGHFDALHMLGLIAVRVGNLAAAAELYGRALAVNGRSAECHFNIAQVFRAQGRNRDAVAHLGEATAIKRDYVAAHVSLADMLAAQNDLEDARARYEQALAIDPRLVDARHGLANLLRQLGRLDEAAEQFRQVVALRPDYAEAFSNLGVVLAAQGRWADAAEQYQRAIAIKPELVDVYRNLARALRSRRTRGRGPGGDHARARDRRDRRSQGDLRSVRAGCGQRPARRGISRSRRPRVDGRLGPLRRPVTARGVPVHDQRVRPRRGRAHLVGAATRGRRCNGLARGAV